MYRRSIAEFVTLYELEPSLKCLWVEGTTDQSVLNWFTQQAEVHDIEIKTFDDVEIGADVVSKYGMLPSNRTRLIAFALELEASIDKDAETAKILAIVDRDLDELLDRSIPGRYIEYTELSSLEMYFSETSIVSKLLHMSSAKPIDDSVRLLAIRIALSITTIKAAATSLGEKWKWVEFGPSLTKKGKGPWLYDKTHHIERLLNKNAAMDRRDEVVKLAMAFEDSAKGREDRIVRGHDFIDVLFHTAGESVRPKGSINSAQGLFVALFMGASVEYLQKFNLFKRILAWA